MKKLLIVTAAAALLALASIEEASARSRGGGFGGGFRGAGVGGGGFRVLAMGADIAVMGIGGGYRGAAVAGLGDRGAEGLGARYFGGYGAGRRVAWAGRGYYPYRYGYRRWAWPVVAGLGFAAATSYYNNCWRYDGWQWVNVCYQPYGMATATTATATATGIINTC